MAEPSPGQVRRIALPHYMDEVVGTLMLFEMVDVIRAFPKCNCHSAPAVALQPPPSVTVKH